MFASHPCARKPLFGPKHWVVDISPAGKKVSLSKLLLSPLWENKALFSLILFN